MLFRSLTRNQYTIAEGNKLDVQNYEDGAPIIYTERKDGVIPAYNIRTDKWDIALTAMDQVNKNWETKNMEKPGTFAEDVPDKTDGGTPSEN